MQRKRMGWGWIIFWLVFFWPVGLFFLIQKLATDKSALMSGKTASLSVVAWVLIILGGVGFIGLLSEPNSGGGIIVALVFVLGGVLLLQKSFEAKRRAARYKTYIDMVVNQNVRSIDYIASAVGGSYDAITKDLQDMINIGYLRDAYIHQGNREISLKQYEPAPTQQAPYGQPTPQTKAVRCPGCGANNTVVIGRVSECEYCGTSINA